MSAWWDKLVNDRSAFVAKGAALCAGDAETAALWNSHSCESRLADVWATADDLLSCYEACQGSDETKLCQYAQRMDSLISMICADESRGPRFRESIREAQWEVFNFVFGDNSFGHSGRSSMQWFDQFMYDINFDLV